MEHYKITEFNRRRLQRAENHCYRADVFVGDEYDGWVWLSISEIKKIMKDSACKISGHEEFIKNGK